MEISDGDLRALVRDSVARHAAEAGAPHAPSHHLTFSSSHPSHVKFLLPAGGDGDGMCVIEPSVRCTHCGYCQSYGH